MNDPPPEYDELETLPPPGPIGRAVRLVLGAACLSVVAAVATHVSWFFSGRALDEGGLWLLTLVGIYMLPDVVNIGFSRAWKRRSVLGFTALLLGVTAVAGRVMYGSVATAPTGTMVSVGLLYVYGHLGASFVLAAVLATPGCEMRAMPHLRALIAGGRTRERYCPGVLTPIDRWEWKLRRPGT